ncbi:MULTISPECIES: tRNA-uridine aminocarboxypropyltransferase [unclassified Acidovorax]|uniref:tRNA-uridine aminocarboxypropyltransferase n=1 Tax=unclassified Acidovorax TaxID=2684926 RepID=UPI00288310CF|nr:MULTISPECIES: tRNA-uridine aminocarboxypropyltransferase [unclassified Acidovorax]
MMSSTRRLRCVACLRPGATCLCDVAAPVAHQAEVLILQHPLESSHAKGTARLLHLCLPRSRLEVGEVFDVESLQRWLAAPWDGAALDTPPDIGQRTVLLYPPSPPDPALPLIAPPPLPPAWLAGDPAALRLVVLDGTWRKSRKMLYLNPLLQQLPRLLLPDLPAPRYRIRRAHAPHQLSTLEATCTALAHVEGSADRYAPVLDALEVFMARQSARVPPAASPANC